VPLFHRASLLEKVEYEDREETGKSRLIWKMAAKTDVVVVTVVGNISPASKSTM